MTLQAKAGKKSCPPAPIIKEKMMVDFLVGTATVLSLLMILCCCKYIGTRKD